MSRNVLTARELSAYRKQLVNLEARLNGRVAGLESEALRAPQVVPADLRNDPPAHEADPAARSSEDEVALALLGSEEQMLADVRAALARFEAKTFGVCARCTRAIGRTRLDAIPYAAHCTRCARELAAPPGEVAGAD